MKFLAILSHGCMVLAVTTLTFLVLDHLNPMMGFLSSGYSRLLLVALCLCGFGLGLSQVIRSRRKE